MSITLAVKDSVATLAIDGSFDFESHTQFREISRQCLSDPAVCEVQVDFDRVQYLDSSALGMLLLLRERAVEGHKTVSLINVHGISRKIIEVANFSRLFRVLFRPDIC